MTTTISTPTALQAANTGAALRSALQPTVDALAQQFNNTLAKALENAVQQAQTATQGTGGSTAPQPTAQAAPASAPAASSAAAGTAWKAPWLKGAESAGQYLHKADADHATLQQGKPRVAEFMQATGCDSSTASNLLYGVVSGGTDFRDWNAIMASADPVLAARQATGALYNSDLPYSDGHGFKPTARETLAAEGNFAWVKVNNRESLWLMNKQGEALRQVALSAPEILRTSRDYGLDPADLAPLADQMDARQVRYAPGILYPGSDGGVDLRNLAQGGLGTTYDWTSDPLAHLKGPGAQDAVAADALMAREMGLQRTPVARGSITPPATTTPAPAAAASNGAQASSAAATSTAGMDALGKQLTQSLLAQLQNALQDWQSTQQQGSAGATPPA